MTEEAGPKPWMPDPGQAQAKQHAPATLRNRAAIAEVLKGWLPAGGTVLEVASGSGEHIVYFASAFPDLSWQPSDPDAAGQRSIAAWTGEAHLGNVEPPIALDARAPRWDVADAEAVLCINMVHISPWAATEGLFAGAGHLLPPGAPLILYGPYVEDGVETAVSNLSFDASLRARDPSWGLRDLAEVSALAARHGFGAPERREMPANNLMLRFVKGG
ncbi:DUF938 domain-containing protein [Novosphingopyxis sp.]|uniref:DUF938 domain-containing protein n=1 Tax=Novosphingopyxis sp. TaxID=2709690 RepID=UPI003B5CEB92